MKMQCRFMLGAAVIASAAALTWASAGPLGQTARVMWSGWSEIGRYAGRLERSLRDEALREEIKRWVSDGP